MLSFSAPVIDAILAGVAVEFAVIALVLRRLGRTRFVAPAGLFLASGGALMVALRFARAGDQDQWIPAAMFVAMLLHIACMAVTYRTFANPSDDKP